MLPETVFKLEVEPKFFLEEGGIIFGLPWTTYTLPIYLVLLIYFVLLLPGIIFILVWSPIFWLNYLSPRVLVIWSFIEKFFVKVCWFLLLGVFYLSLSFRPLFELPCGPVLFDAFILPEVGGYWIPWEPEEFTVSGYSRVDCDGFWFRFV